MKCSHCFLGLREKDVCESIGMWTEYDKMLPNRTQMDKRSSKLNEGPLLRRLLETLGMVEIPQVTLPSPPQEENGRNHSKQWKSTPLYSTNTEPKNLNHIMD